ncbi:hypothetical protein BCR39DRAFT_558149 [Naematelia encephala]|uniref:Uncharacterized protein n=1 Tax=Naematelia encephala TaxID=71784 RepID=A0A1Y2BA16_9TREE|nr:hypothetical protein BCR39DRAFT_558149 [Naematelia encephala]
MASMEDLVSTLSGGAHIGKQANELQDLHGPLPPPAPASSWNDPAPPSSFDLSSTSAWLAGSGNSPRQGPATGFMGKRETGFSVPPPKHEQSQTGMPYHASVLPVKASPKDTGGFDGDAFKPLWERRTGGAPEAGSSGGGGGKGGGAGVDGRNA